MLRLVVAVLVVLGLADDGSATRCGRHRCRRTIAEQCDGLGPSKELRKACVHGVIDACRAGRCVCKKGRVVSCAECTTTNVGYPCGRCGSGVCGFDCATASCVQTVAPFACYANGPTEPPACPAGVSCTLTNGGAVSYCLRGLLGVAVCAVPCP